VEENYRAHVLQACNTPFKAKIVIAMAIRVSPEELARFNEGDSSLSFKDGSGYIAEMTVYHELHCIKRLRRHFHLDRYYPNRTEYDMFLEEQHIGIHMMIYNLWIV
jgi:hypothetical protein